MITKWVDILQKGRPKAFINLVNCSGIGDLINSTPAIRHFKEANREYVLSIVVDDFYKYEILKNNPYVDYLIPANNTYVRFSKSDKAIMADWSFLQQHAHPSKQPHVCGAYDWYINKKHTMDWRMEMFCNEKDLIDIKSIVDQIPKSKPWAVVCANYTMFNRMLPQESWQYLVNRLIKKYHVISIGGVTDFKLDNVIDLRNKFKINQIPIFLNHCEKIFTVNSGSLHVAGCNPNIEIVFLSMGEFPSSVIVPYRNGQLGWNCKIIEHDCPLKQHCFTSHTCDSIFREYLNKNMLKYKDKYPAELIKKWTCWEWCIKKEDKYSCGQLIADKVKDMDF
jgi:ADP-heptose:LPS heptosyltransferase